MHPRLEQCRVLDEACTIVSTLSHHDLYTGKLLNAVHPSDRCHSRRIRCRDRSWARAYCCRSLLYIRQVLRLGEEPTAHDYRQNKDVEVLGAHPVRCREVREGRSAAVVDCGNLRLRHQKPTSKVDRQTGRWDDIPESRFKQEEKSLQSLASKLGQCRDAAWNLICIVLDSGKQQVKSEQAKRAKSQQSKA